MQSPLSALSRPILPLPLLPQPPLPPRLFSTRFPTATSSSCHDTVSRTRLRVSEIKAISSPVSVVEEEEGVENEEEDCPLEFVEVGFVCNVHGLKGELKVNPTTDFPELRFCKPGRRWLRTRVMGEEMVREVELTGGRNHPGQKIWIISIAGIDTVDEAKQIIGSTLLVKDDDRPSLEDDEFYTRDLLGMTVILKDGGTQVGTVVNVVNHGSNDLLHVMLDSAKEIHGKPGSSLEAYASGPLVWIPFVEAIVPDVDMTKRVMQITPPKGLLELNLRSDSRSKKERSHLEWKQKKKFQKRVIAAKKKLIEIGQKHVLDGFCFGEKDKKSLLANQIVNINFNLFQQAIKGINTPSGRIILSKFLNMETIQKNSFQVSRNCLSAAAVRNDMDETQSVLQKNGLDILREHKVGIILVTSGTGSSSSRSQIHEFLLGDSSFMKADGQRISTPLIIVSPENEVQFYQEQFSNHDYFGFDKEEVSFFEEEKLPVLSSLLDDQRTHRMLLRSPWEITQSPVGSGGVFSVLSSQNLLDDFSKWGIEYVQICTFTEQIAIGHLTFLGLIGSRSMDVGIKLLNEVNREDEFDIIFSMKYLRKLVKQVGRPRFDAIPMQNEHVELVKKEWIDVHPSAPNSICFQTSIFDLLDASLAADTTCILHITD